MKGSAMVAACIVIVIGTIIVSGFIAYISHESKIIRMANDSVKLLYVAEAGLERKIYEIGNGDYANIPNIDYPEDSELESYYYVTVEQDGSVYTITSTGEISTGLYTQERRLKRIVRQKASIFNLWDLAVFSGGATVGQIAGNTNIRGSVYVLGEESFIDMNEDNLYDSGIDTLIDENGNAIRDHLNSTDYGINGTGTFYIGNDYSQFGGNNAIPQTFLGRITSVPTLDAGVNVKYGKISLGGSSQIGNLTMPMDLVNSPDGFSPSDPPTNVFVEAGGLLYDRGMFNEEIRLPSLYDVVNGVTRLQALQNGGLGLTVGVQIPATITPDSVFSVSDGVNSLSMNGNGQMTINGIIYIDGNGNNLTFDRATGGGPPRDTIYYNGKGSIVFTNGDPAGGLLTINTNLYTQAVGSSAYPENNIIGFMTPDSIKFNVAQLEIMAIFYAGDTITTNQQTSVAGSFISNHVNMSQQVPEIFQVTGIKDNLPPGMINIPPVVVVYGWEEVFE